MKSIRRSYKEESDSIYPEVVVTTLTYSNLHHFYRQEANGFWGLFFIKEYNNATDRNFIFIYKKNPYYRKLWVLFHEYGHYRCYKKRCSCLEYYFNKREKTIDDYVLSEFHAYKYALDMCVKKRYERSRQDLVSFLNSFKNKKDGYGMLLYKKLFESETISLIMTYREI